VGGTEKAVKEGAQEVQEKMKKVFGR